MENVVAMIFKMKDSMPVHKDPNETQELIQELLDRAEVEGPGSLSSLLLRAAKALRGCPDGI